MCSETSEAVGTTWEHAKLEFQKFLKIRITLLHIQLKTQSKGLPFSNLHLHNYDIFCKSFCKYCTGANQTGQRVFLLCYPLMIAPFRVTTLPTQSGHQSRQLGALKLVCLLSTAAAVRRALRALDLSCVHMMSS